MSEKLLEVKDLTVVYKGDHELVRAVNGISFDLAPGEVIGLVGETGAGKTTTALSILRLLPDKVGMVTGGSILMDGEDLQALPEVAMRDIYRGQRISMIFQDPMTSLNPVLRVGEQIAEALIYHDTEKRPAPRSSSGWRRPWSWWASPRAGKTIIPTSFPAG